MSKLLKNLQQKIAKKKSYINQIMTGNKSKQKKTVKNQKNPLAIISFLLTFIFLPIRLSFWLIWIIIEQILSSIKYTIKFFIYLLKKPFFRYAFVLFVVLAFIGLIYLTKDLPSPRRLASGENFAVSTQIFDRSGILLYEIFADENRTPIKIESLPDHILQATIAIEDQNFYKHFGFDISGIARAVRVNLQGGRLEGGSTITQQLVKNALLTRERSITRKLKEAILSVMTETIYTKDEILEMYLNYISYGGTSVGIEAAAQAYFKKSAQDLTLAEASLLAGLPQAPSRYSPFGSSPEEGKRRQIEVLRRMTEDGYITAQEAEAAQNETLKLAISSTDIKAPHFVFYVRDLLYQEYGVEMVEKGGLRVTTSLDLELHHVAQATLSAEINNLERMRVSNGAALIVKPDTGEILSMIGSKDYFNTADDGQVNVTLAQRQPGSSIKPLMYASAFQEKTLNPGTVLLDVPTCFVITGQPNYCPRNYDGSFRNQVTVRNSLGNSLNIPAVKALHTIGVTTFIDHASKMGISSWKNPERYGLSLTLGGGEVRMIDMAQSFSVLANKGVHIPLAPILKIENYRGDILFENDLEKRKEALIYLNDFEDEVEKDEATRVIDAAPAYLTSHIMQDNQARMSVFGSRSALVIPNQVVSAKTGTTNDLKDNWTIGFTPEYLVVTWVGNNDGSPMNRSFVSGITGAAPIFNKIMSFVLQDKEPIWQEKPADVLSAGVCAHGFPPQTNQPCQVRYTELYWAKSKPSIASEETKEVWIDPNTGLPPPPGEEIEGLILESRTFFQDPISPPYCLDCTRIESEDGSIQYERQIILNSATQTRHDPQTF